MLDASDRPIYAVDAGRQLVYCNPALAAWLGVEAAQIVGRDVEYHSEPPLDRDARSGLPPLTDLCPPPQALAGVPSQGTVGCVGRGGRLVHRRAEFIPLAGENASAGGVLVLLAAVDLTPQQLADELSEEPSADELHRVIRSFRRSQAAHYALESLIGQSAAMRKVRAQVAAAAASQASVAVCGTPGSGRQHVARAIHYHAKDTAGKLVPVDCAVATEQSLRWALDSLRGSRDFKARNTLLLLNLEQLPPLLQSQLLPVVTGGVLAARTVATVLDGLDAGAVQAALDDLPAKVDPQLLSALSTIRIELPRLAERLEDLPLLAQFFLETANRGSAKQVGSLRPEALDQLALYRWPGGLDELRDVVAAAHAAAATHEIAVADLPPVVHHAAKSAALPRRIPEKISLDELVESIEREVITRALAQVGGNKSAAAELLGITRPRLYRRMVQLGLIVETKTAAEDLAQ